jgi:FG-GAP-like repeat
MRAARRGRAGGFRRGVIAVASVVAALVVAPPAGAATSATFGAPTDYPTGTKPQSVAIGDFNGDAKRDLAIANSADDTVSVLLGNGNGTFRAKTDYPTGVNVYSVAVADLNGDKKLDLVTANANVGSSGVSVLLGNGDGTFRARTDYATGYTPYSVAVADLNGDNKLDVVTANTGGARGVSVLLGNGDGTFRAKADYQAGYSPWSVAVADFNRDGSADLAVTDNASGTASVSMLLGNGDGTFKAKTDVSLGNVRPRTVTVGDFNRDGSADLAFGDFDRNAVGVLLGKGDGTFKAATEYATGALPYSVLVGDFDADGDQDLATAGGSTVSVLLSKGDGTFNARTDHATGTDSAGMAAADFNADGRPDLATADYSADTVSVLLNNTDVDPPSPVIFAPVNDATYAQGQTVKADYACMDEFGSGIKSCQGPVPDGGAIDTSSLGSHAFTVTATDNAGNTSSLTMTYAVSDQTAPSVSITTPADGASYRQGQAVSAGYACADNAGGSGVASCRGTVADGGAIDTGALGSHGFTVATTDRAGNTTSKTVHYTVITPPPPAAPQPPATSPVPPGPSVAALASRGTRVGPRGMVSVRMSCTGPDGRPCAGKLVLETDQPVPARAVQPVRKRHHDARRGPGLDLGARTFALAAGHTTRVRVRLNRRGRRVFSTLARVRLRARLEAKAGTRASDRRIVVRASRAPSTTVLDPTQMRASHAGRVKVRVLCHAPRGERCHGRLRLADRSGRALAAGRISVAGQRRKTVTVRLDHHSRRRFEHTNELRVQATTITTIPVGLTTTRNRHITIRRHPA